MTFHHYSVLLRETIEGLAIRADGVYVDGTLGGGGHALSICERLSERGRLIGIDQDGAAIEAASERLKDYRDRAVIVRGNYEDIAEILMRLQIEQVDGICLDLGVSSYQLDEGERGFSYRTDAALDMRMDQRGERTAADIVNSYSEEALFRIIRDYGEDRFARNIAKHIVQYREKKRIETTLELSGIISGAIPARVRALSGHPAKRSFQAIRIELNRELEVLENTLDRMIDLLSEGGRLCVISFHSLEDRIVKSKFRTAENPCICPPDFPVCSCGRKSRGIVLTKKPILPSEEELLENRRSQSAKLRIFEKRTEGN
ncbi:16S rRNA (cytosine(1402)-N(4))-methyltransferase RsmH [Oribacterium sp. oral taxon 078]|uniref:16S rRNA (cytosine(1402)-N(4))-methyltransferase RsmH n=1 Tax=Oribacterium sp. oral taxon 078 TaxID=652706 RepID=UPI0004226802|nr:16S rRNA (cytosine(1402)-N(4))-methyltransferase RsmH [Oribacterium sp. oral taxon 078]